ncbi:MAG: DUF1003 domain-containing protein [Pseudonocardia sp.]|nr:DUF1003 domain-containing protein [Pseudonocardia sp.]
MATEAPAAPAPKLREDHHSPFGGDTFGRQAERFARFFGTPTFIVGQTLIVALWIVLNALALTKAIAWDKYPFIALNLAFSLQAAYAAPLILLAQNRQDDRDRVNLEQDRQQSSQQLADTDFVARELASVRRALGDVVTRDFLRSELARLDAARDTGRDRDISD